MEDLDDWEVLPDHGFLRIHDDEGKKFFSRKYTSPTPENVFKNYFMCPSPPEQSSKFVESTDKPGCSRVPPQQLIPVPIQLEPQVIKRVQPPDDGLPFEVLNLKPSSPLLLPEQIGSPKIAVTAEADQDLFSQVFFKKETEFVNMKLDSPKSNNNSSS